MENRTRTLLPGDEGAQSVNITPIFCCQSDIILQNSLGRVSLTTDAWSDPNLISFLGITAHFIARDNVDGKPALALRSRMLAFRHIQGSHTGERLARVFYQVIKDAGIERKVHWLCIQSRLYN